MIETDTIIAIVTIQSEMKENHFLAPPANSRLINVATRTMKPADQSMDIGSYYRPSPSEKIRTEQHIDSLQMFQ